MNLKDKAESSTEISPILDLWIDSFTWPYRCFIMLTMGKESMTQINDIIETLATAKLAMEENPGLKARIDDLLIQVYALEDKVTHLEIAQELQDTAYTEACIKVTELEANLEAARFQEQSIHSKLDKFIASISEAVGEVVPHPITALELVGEPTDMGVITDKLEIRTNKPDLGSVDFNPSVTDGLQPETNVLGCTQPESNPLPYSGRPYSFKPDSVGWRAWVEGGGQRPWWLTEGELDKLEPKQIPAA